MLKKIYLTVLACLLTSPLFSQSLDKMMSAAMNTSKITLAQGDSVQVFSILPANYKANIKADNHYLWYTGNQIKITQGGYGGKLLDGEYTVFTRQKDLLEKGTIRKGLKVGEWTTWYVSGNIHRLEHWDRSIKNGSFSEFYPDGKLQREGKYRDGKLQGNVFIYDAGGKKEKVKYRNGELKKEKKKKDKRVDTEKEVNKKKLTKRKAKQQNTSEEPQQQKSKKNKRKNNTESQLGADGLPTNSNPEKAKKRDEKPTKPTTEAEGNKDKKSSGRKSWFKKKEPLHAE